MVWEAIRSKSSMVCAAMQKAGVHVCDTPSVLGATMKQVLGKK